jgi:hypothetical protein
MENAVSQLLRFLLFFLLSLGAVWLLAKARGTQGWMKPKVLAAIILAAVVFDLFSFGMSFNPATDPKLAFFPTRTTDFLRKHAGHSRVVSYKPLDAEGSRTFEWMLPNTPLAYNLRDTHGYDSLVPGRYTNLIGTTDWSPQGAWPAPESSMVDALGVKYAVTTEEITASGWKLVASEEANIYENTQALPRAFVVGVARGRRPPLQLTGNQNFDQLPYPDAPPVNFTRDAINTVDLSINPPVATDLVLMDSAYPGWRVYVDNRPGRWEVANYDFRSVWVPKEKHTVSWRYEPATFRVGLYISLAALALLFGAFGYHVAGKAAR